MAKNKTNNFKNSSGYKNKSGNSVNDTSTSNKTSNSSAKDTHAQVPDNSPRRSGPGGN